MVIDWHKHIEECIRYTKVIPTFHAMSVEQYYQQILITKKLVSIGYSNEQILNWFRLAETDCTKDEVDIIELKALAKKRRWPRSHNFSVYITQKEIKHIDGLKTTKENKSFLLAAIAFAKTMNIKKTKPTFNIRDRSFIYYIATGRDDYNVGKQRHASIQAFIHELTKSKEINLTSFTSHIKIKTHRVGGARKDITNVLLGAKWIEWDAKSGYEINNLETQTKILCDQAFEEDVRTCEMCKEQFIVVPKMRRTVCVCDNCYSLFRKKDRHSNLERSHRKKVEATTSTKNLHYE